MKHVFRVKAVVPEVVHHQFIAGKINKPLIILSKLMNEDAEEAFAELVFGYSVFGMPYRTYRHDNYGRGIHPSEDFIKTLEMIQHLFQAQQSFIKEGLGLFVTVGNQLSVGLQFIDKSRSERENNMT